MYRWASKPINSLHYRWLLCRAYYSFIFECIFTLFSMIFELEDSWNFLGLWNPHSECEGSVIFWELNISPCFVFTFFGCGENPNSCTLDCWPFSSSLCTTIIQLEFNFWYFCCFYTVKSTFIWYNLYILYFLHMTWYLSSPHRNKVMAQTGPLSL